MLLKAKDINRITFRKNKGIIIKPVIMSQGKASRLNQKNKNIIYNFKDKSIIISVLGANIKMDVISDIVSDIISVI